MPDSYSQIITLPIDGTPLKPSSLFEKLRQIDPVVPLQYPDGHVGWLVLERKIAQNILMDTRFSQLPHRFPGSSDFIKIESPVDESDREAMKSADLLSLDGEQHRKCRRAITSKFSFKSIESYLPTISRIIENHLENMLTHQGPVNLTEVFSEPVSRDNHAYILGIPIFMIGEFEEYFVKESDRLNKVEFVRKVYEYKVKNPSDDVIGHMISVGLSRSEVEGLIFVLFSSGRDSIAYMISTSIVALLENHDQYEIIRNNLPVSTDAVEELMRYCSMFVTLFPRTALEDIEIGPISIKKGDSVSISPVAINRDSKIWENPDELLIDRKMETNLTFGHGIHGCLGQGVARVVIQEALTQLIRRLPNIKLVEADQLTPMKFAHPVATYQSGKVIISW